MVSCEHCGRPCGADQGTPDGAEKSNQTWIVDTLIFRIKRLETLVDAVKDIKRDGIAGRGKEIAGSQTVEILHERWVALLDALNGVS